MLRRVDSSPLLATALLLGGLLGGQTARAQPVENTPRLCQNQQDDDGDGLVDCADDGCSRLIFCVNYQPEEQGEELCRNGIDDDQDGQADCDDEGCVEVCGARSEALDGEDGQPGTRGIYRPRVVERGPEVGFVEHDDPRDYPFAYAERPMTYLQGMLVPRAGLNAFNLGGLLSLGGIDAWTQLALGVSYGVLDELQVTVVPVSARLSFGDPEYGSPALGLTFRFFSEEVVELGLWANVVLPLTTAAVGTSGVLFGPPNSTLADQARLSDFTQLDGAFNLRLRFAEIVRMDLTLPMVTVIFPEVAGSVEPEVQLWFDLRVGFSITDYAYAGLYSGASLSSLNDFGNAFIPFGFFAGAVIPGPSRRGPLADLGIRFGWPYFINSDPGTGDAVNGDAWQLTFDLRFFTFLLP